MSEVICEKPMAYAGLRRWRGEIIQLIGGRNDDAMVSVGYVRIITSDFKRNTFVRDDATGRQFIDRASLETYLREGDPTERRIIVDTKVRRGRPRKAPAATQDGVSTAALTLA